MFGRKVSKPQNRIDCLIGAGTVIEGNITFSGGLRVDGHVRGNVLAAVGPFAIERGLVKAGDPLTEVRIFMQNTGQIAVAQIATPDGEVCYDGDLKIDGVPGTAAEVLLNFCDIA